MKIDSVKAVPYSPANKALYFTKTPTIMLDKSVEFLPHEITSETKSGIRYLKDNDIPKNLKKKLSEIPFIKKLSKKFETFVWFVESKNPEGYSSWVKISHVKGNENYMTTHYAIGKSNIGQDIARENLYSNIKNENFLVI